MVDGERFLFHGFARFVLEVKCWRESVSGEMLAGKCLACCAHTAHDCRWRDNQTRAWSRRAGGSHGICY